MDNNRLQCLIEEYKYLRNECLAIFSQRTLPLIYMSLIQLMLITAAIQYSNDILYSFLLIAIFPIAIHWLGKRKTIATIACYIKNNLEPQLEGMEWENWIWKKRGNKIDDFASWIVSDLIIYYFIIIGVTGSIYGFGCTRSPVSLLLLIVNAILFLFLIIVCLWNRSN